MAKKKNSLDNIVNMVSSVTKDFTEVFVATADGSYGKFTMPTTSSALRFESLTIQSYLAETQHYIGNKQVFNVNYASKHPSDK